MRNDDLLLALRPFLSERIRRHVAPLADETQVRISIEAPNGAAINITLKELRALWAMHDAYKAFIENAAAHPAIPRVINGPDGPIAIL